jgi:LPS export ABC transporter protein LptC
MRRRERALGALLLLTLLAACAPEAVKRAAEATPTPGVSASPAAGPTTPAVHVVGEADDGRLAHITVESHKRLAYEIYSTKTEATQTTGVASFANAQVLFHDPKGGVLDARAPNALANQTTKTVRMKGGVHARTHSGSVLTCDTLTYNADTELLHAVGHVVLTTSSGSRVTSDEATSDLRLEQVDFGGGKS